MATLNPTNGWTEFGAGRGTASARCEEMRKEKKALMGGGFFLGLWEKGSDQILFAPVVRFKVVVLSCTSVAIVHVHLQRAMLGWAEGRWKRGSRGGL
jgi:hypothetical protein